MFFLAGTKFIRGFDVVRFPFFAEGIVDVPTVYAGVLEWKKVHYS